MTRQPLDRSFYIRTSKRVHRDGAIPTPAAPAAAGGSAVKKSGATGNIPWTGTPCATPSSAPPGHPESQYHPFRHAGPAKVLLPRL